MVHIREDNLIGSTSPEPRICLWETYASAIGHGVRLYTKGLYHFLATEVHMIKTKFGDSVRSKEKTAQINEVLLKVLCHNIVVLVHEMFEMGINHQF